MWEIKCPTIWGPYSEIWQLFFTLTVWKYDKLWTPPPFESENKVGDVRFRFETWLPNYLVGLTNLSCEKPNFGNKLLSKNENVPHGYWVLLLSQRRRTRRLWMRPAPVVPPALVSICTLPEYSHTHLPPAPGVCLSSNTRNQRLYSVAYCNKNTSTVRQQRTLHI